MLPSLAFLCSCPKAPLCTSGDQLLAKATYSLAHSQGRLARGGTDQSVSRGSCGAALRTAGRHDSLAPSLLSFLLLFFLPSLSPSSTTTFCLSTSLHPIPF